MTDRISEIRARCEAATPGPWVREDTPDYAEIHVPDGREKGYLAIALVEEDYNADFIANSISDIPYLLDRLAEAESKMKSINKSLDFADKQRQRSQNYTELAINNGLALGRIAVTLQHEYAPPEEGESK